VVLATRHPTTVQVGKGGSPAPSTNTHLERSGTVGLTADYTICESANMRPSKRAEKEGRRDLDTCRGNAGYYASLLWPYRTTVSKLRSQTCTAEPLGELLQRQTRGFSNVHRTCLRGQQVPHQTSNKKLIILLTKYYLILFNSLYGPLSGP